MTHTKLSVLDHIEELRNRALKVIGFWFVCTCICYAFVDWFFLLLTQPFGIDLIFTGPQEALIAALKVAGYVGIALTMPLLLYQAWRFVSPGLHAHEKRVLLIGMPACVALFVGGIAFCYYIVLPHALGFLLNFGGAQLTPMIRVHEYVSFVGLLLLAFGALFELPLIAALLAAIGLIDHHTLRSKRRYAIILILLVAAFITPPDAFTLFLMAIPIVLLYEVSIWIAYFLGSKS